MKYSAALTLAAVAVGVQAQGAPDNLRPSGGPPPGCVETGTGSYEISIVLAPGASDTPSKRSLEQRAECGGEGTLVVKLNNGVLTDSLGRIGSIVANRQFQFDGPPAQTGAIYTAGFSICQNSSLAIGPTTDFFQCLSGDFYNLYDQPSESSCRQIKMNTIPCGPQSGGSAPPASGGASQQPDGQPTASSAGPVVSQQTDGQPTATQAPTAPVVSQISDGQPQATTPVVSQIPDGQPQANGTVSSAAPSAPIATGAAAPMAASGAFAAIGAIAAFFL